MIEDGGPAYPVFAMYRGADGDLHPTPTQYPGMSLRDHFAGLAMAAIVTDTGWLERESLDESAERLGISPKEWSPYKHWPMIVAMDAYVVADAMLAQRTKQQDSQQ